LEENFHTEPEPEPVAASSSDEPKVRARLIDLRKGIVKVLGVVA
jgi:hypothetical protein